VLRVKYVLCDESYVWYDEYICVMSTYLCFVICVFCNESICVMGWLRSVGSIKSQVSFAEYRLLCRALLQKRPIILSILLTKATPYVINHMCHVMNTFMLCEKYIYIQKNHLSQNYIHTSVTKLYICMYFFFGIYMYVFWGQMCSVMNLHVLCDESCVFCDYSYVFCDTIYLF